MYATMTIVQDGPVIRHCRGRVLGRSIVATLPDYARDVVVLHALQSLRCWIRTEDQRTLHHVDMRAGGPALAYALQRWLDQGVCSLESAAASELLEQLESWGSHNKYNRLAQGQPFPLPLLST